MFFIHKDACINLENMISFEKDGKFKIMFSMGNCTGLEIEFDNERERELAWLSIIQCKIQNLGVCFADSIHQQKAVDEDV